MLAGAQDDVVVDDVVNIHTTNILTARMNQPVCLVGLVNISGIHLGRENYKAGC